MTEIWDKWIEGVVTGGRPICRERGRHIEIGETLVFAVALIDSAIPLEPAPSEGRTRPVFGKALTKKGGTNNGPASPKPAVKPTGQMPPGESPCRSG